MRPRPSPAAAISASGWTRSGATRWQSWPRASTKCSPRSSGRSPGSRFETDLRPSLVRGQPERIGHAVLNLLDNAVKWSPAGAPVDVRVADGVVEVRDRGPGIAAADLPLVFERFYRAPSARGTPGSGLGLAIVKHVAEAHGGAAEAENADGGGSVFRLRLPHEAIA